jgi:excisionase family DNA binding protein
MLDLKSDTLLTDREVGELLGVSRTTLWRLRRTGNLPFGKVGREFRYRQSEVLEWVRKGEAGSRQLPLELQNVVARSRAR